MNSNIINKNEINTQLIDREILNLCLALNLIPGIKTLSSCCGHGEGPINIFFKAENLKDLYRLSSMCKNEEWEIRVLFHGFYTCKTKEGIFCFSSISCGKTAYQTADKFVDLILNKN